LSWVVRLVPFPARATIRRTTPSLPSTIPSPWPAATC